MNILVELHASVQFIFRTNCIQTVSICFTIFSLTPEWATESSSLKFLHLHWNILWIANSFRNTTIGFSSRFSISSGQSNAHYYYINNVPYAWNPGEIILQQLDSVANLKNNPTITVNLSLKCALVQRARTYFSVLFYNWPINQMKFINSLLRDTMNHQNEIQ